MPDDFQIDDNAVLASLQAMAREAPKIAEQELRVEGELIKNRSMRLTPVKTGALRDSHVVKSKQSASGPEVRVGVGGPSAKYAIHVHERVELRHAPPTRSKFLETAVAEALPGMGVRVGKRIASRLGKEGGS